MVAAEELREASAGAAPKPSRVVDRGSSTTASLRISRPLRFRCADRPSRRRLHCDGSSFDRIRKRLRGSE